MGEIASASPRVIAVDVYQDPRDALDAWRELAAVAPTTPYQLPGWILPWIDTVGASSGIVPMLVVARGEAGRPLALLPMGVHRQGGLVIAEFLGGRDSNFNLGLFRPGTTWARDAILDLLRRAAAASPIRPDLYALRNQPHGWDGTANPLLALPHQPSPSFAHKARLQADPEAFFKEYLSRESRKKLRQKAVRLSAHGAVSVARAETAQAVAEVLDAFATQRRDRCEALGLSTDELPDLLRFLEVAAAPGPAPAIEFYALRCGDRIIATLGGARHARRFSGMLTSFSADPDVVRASPGEMLLAEVMRLQCLEGYETFDLGVGEARYKDTYCPEVEPLSDCIVPVSMRGRLLARVEALRLQAKRSVKQSPWAWPLVLRARRLKATLTGR